MVKKEYISGLGEVEICDYTPTAEETVKIQAFEEQAEKDIAMWGGKRENAGRKKKDEDNVLRFQIRVSKREKEFLKYARSHNLNYEDLMQG